MLDDLDWPWLQALTIVVVRAAVPEFAHPARWLDLECRAPVGIHLLLGHLARALFRTFAVHFPSLHLAIAAFAH